MGKCLRSKGEEKIAIRGNNSRTEALNNGLFSGLNHRHFLCSFSLAPFHFALTLDISFTLAQDLSAGYVYQCNCTEFSATKMWCCECVWLRLQSFLSLLENHCSVCRIEKRECAHVLTCFGCAAMVCVLSVLSYMANSCSELIYTRLNSTLFIDRMEKKPNSTRKFYAACGWSCTAT